MKNLHSQMEFFCDTKNWKNYWIKDLEQLVQKSVLDVGTGIGSNLSFYLKIKSISKITCIEPDKKLFLKLKKKFKNKKNYKLTLKNIELSKLTIKKRFDTIIYADVLEHIKKDLNEINLAIKYLKKDGRLIILCPAHNFLFTPFDKNVGHFRRYDKKMFMKFKVPYTKIEKIYYLDSVGFFLSLLNKLFLNRNPKKREIEFWDKVVVPFSKIADYLLCNLFGKSIVCVYKKIY